MENVNPAAPQKPEKKSSSGFFNGIIDSVLSVPETLVESTIEMGLNIAETVDGFAKSIANVVLPENTSQQPTKA